MNKTWYGFFLFLMASTLCAQISNASRPKTYPRYDHAIKLESTVETSANVEFGDLNGDGNLDILLAKGRHWPLINRVLFGDGKGGILRSHDLGTVADRSYSGRLVDIDKDGDSFSSGISLGNLSARPYALAVSDLNLDGHVDIIVGYVNASSAAYFNEGQGKGFFLVPFGDDQGTVYGFDVADFNNDGKPDIAAARSGATNMLYFANPSKGK